MKKLSFLLYLSFSFSCSFGQIVNIPDVNFKNRLVNTNCAQLTSPAWLTDVDTNNDGEIQVTEAQQVLKLDVSTNEFNTNGNIFNLDGLQSFTNLTELNCKGNSISMLEVSSFPNLLKLDCSYNQLTDLNLTGVSNLTSLNCSKNLLTQLDVFGLTNLQLIYCIYNNLTQLDLSGLTALQNFQADVNPMSNLILGNNGALEFLVVSENELTALDLQQTPNLKYLEASANAITDLNFSGLNQLRNVDVSSNNLSSIDLSQNPLLNALFCTNNPNLSTINVRNNLLSGGDPDLLYWPFRFENLPNLASICMDEGEQDWLQFTSYNSGGNAQVFGGPNCNIPLEIGTNSSSEFDWENTFVVAPNPGKSNVSISSTASAVLKSITVYNALGQFIQAVPVFNPTTNLNLDVSHFSAGSYVLKLTTDRGNSFVKFVKL